MGLDLLHCGCIVQVLKLHVFSFQTISDTALLECSSWVTSFRWFQFLRWGNEYGLTYVSSGIIGAALGGLTCAVACSGALKSRRKASSGSAILASHSLCCRCLPWLLLLRLARPRPHALLGRLSWLQNIEIIHHRNWRAAVAYKMVLSNKTVEQSQGFAGVQGRCD